VFLLHRVNGGFKIGTGDAQFPMNDERGAEIIAGLRARLTWFWSPNLMLWMEGQGL
jgi:hypothetical protein